MSVNRPSSYLNWTDGSPSKVVQPPPSFLLDGWVPAMAPPAQYFNWEIWLTDQWIKYFDQVLSAGLPDNVIRLLNGGVWSFVASSGVLGWTAPFNIAIPGIPDANNQVAAGNVTMADGDVAYVSINSPVQSAGSTTTGLPSIFNLSFVQGVTAGMAVTGPGIPSSTTVLSVGVSSVVISNNATADEVDQTYVFSNTAALTVTVTSNEAFLPNLDTILIARRQGPIIYLGINTSQMVLRDHEFKPLLGSGYFDVYTAPAGQSLTSGQVVYISPGPSDSGRTAGAIYPLDCSAAYSSVRATFAGVVISDVSMGGTAEIVFSGFFSTTGLTSGLIYYADPTTPGGITSILPTGSNEKIVPVGFASGTTVLLVSGGSGQSGGPVPAYLVFYDEIIGYGNGTQVNFTTTQPVLSANAVFVFIDGVVQPKTLWSLSGNTITFNDAPATGQEVFVQYVVANQIFLDANQEIPTGAINGINTDFILAGVPINSAATFVWVDGVLVPNTWSLSVTLGMAKITFADAPAVGQDVYVAYLTPVGSGGGSGTVTGAQNLGTGGVGVFSALAGSVLQFNSLKAGANITLTSSGGNIVIAATSTGGSAPAIYGSIGSPETFNPATGLVPGPESNQIWFLQSSGGAVTVTSTTQIANGSTIGQRITLRGVDMTNYYHFRADGTGGVYTDNVSANGDFLVTANQSVTLHWDGTGWYEESRRS